MATPGVHSPKEGRFLGLPYDWRKPTLLRMRSRLWNSADPHLFVPKSYGWGYTFNFYWFAHPFRYLRNHLGS